MDRLDYLSRDSFFTGVSEGVINTDRIIKMLTVVDDELVVEGKGIYSIEKFIVARRLMYWQVYLHKTVVAAEYMMINILRRAKQLASEGIPVPATPALQAFLTTSVTRESFQQDNRWLAHFSRLDDFDIFSGIKVWTDHPDRILSLLSQNLVNRRLYKAILQQEPFNPERVDYIREKVKNEYQLDDEGVNYFVIEDTVSNNAYHPTHDKIKIVLKNREVVDISAASEQLNIAVLLKTVSKNLLCFPKSVNI
jgi:HD superfamily phosphohydrolase